MTGRPLPRSILVVGAGGREHALVRALAGSPARPRVCCAPGNPGIAASAACFPVAADDVPGLVALARREQAELVVVGPEVPLALGLVDALEAAGIPAYGPKADGARLEASKIYTKEILLKYAIPTAAAAFFDEPGAAIAWLRGRSAPIVVKADGLAAGKGVIVALTLAEAEAAVHSLLVVVSGRDYVILPTARDHKRAGDGDTGPNTGGMGACSPDPTITAGVLAQIERTIVRPSVDAIAAEGIDFRGTLFIGLMLTPSGPRVIEFNTRFGDPEAQVVLPRLATDLLALLWAAAHRALGGWRIEVRDDCAICVVVAARGYPGAFPKGGVVTLPPDQLLPPATYILQAGTARGGRGEIVSSGGRVLGVVALATTLRTAADRAYAACGQIAFADKYYRRDIGASFL